MRGLEKPSPLVTREEQAGRVLEVRDDVEEPQPLALRTHPRHHAVEIVEIDPIAVLPYADHLGEDIPKRGERARIRRQLHERYVTRIEQYTRHEIETLLRAGRDQQIVQRSVDAPASQDGADGVEQRTESARGSVLQCGALARAEQVIGDGAKIVPWERVCRRIARRERDEVRHTGRDGPHLPDRRLLHRSGRLREMVGVIHGALPGASHRGIEALATVARRVPRYNLAYALSAPSPRN
jgi:hypothetical protein